MGNTRILVVEDEGAVALDTRTRLINLGYAVPGVAAYGQDAIQKAETLRPDLVLVDVELKGEMDGVQAVENIRAHLDIPVVYLIANNDEIKMRQAEVIEPFGYLLKPFRETDLHSAIEMALFRHRMERRLKDSEEKYRTLFESSPDSITLIGLDGTVLDCNDATTKISGLTRKEIVGRSFMELGVLNGQELSKGVDLFAQLTNQEAVEPVELETTYNGNESGWIEAFPALLKKDGHAYAVQVVTRDISERVRAEREIRCSTEGLAVLNAISAAAVSTLELDIMLHQILDRTCQALDATEGSILLRDRETGELFSTVSLSDRVNSLSQYRLAPGQGIAGWVVQNGQAVRVDDVRRDPRWHQGLDAAIGFETHSLLCAPLMHHGEITGVVEVVNKREGAFNQEDLDLLVAAASIAAAALENARLFAASQARVRELVLLNEIGLAVSSTLDLDKVVHAALSLVQGLFQANGVSLLQPAHETGELGFVWALTGMEPVEIPMRLGPGEGIAGWAVAHRRAVQVKDAQNDPRFSSRVDQHLGTRTRALMAAPLLTPECVIGVLEVVSWQPSIYTADDLRTLQSVASTLAVALENARLYAEQKRLLQQQKQAQTQLIHSEKMSALGRLAASIAHEINNPLQAIQGCLTLAEEELVGKQRWDKLARYLGIVGSEFERVAAIVRRMREFYRPVREGRVSTDVHTVLASVLELANKQLQHSDVNVERHWGVGLPLIQANPDHLKQVFLNLVLNAIDAMPNGGTLRISTTLDQISEDGIRSGAAVRAPAVGAIRIKVSDTGVGMSPEVQSRLFEPFFTSKEHGSGLGLSISYGIIESHNGRINVESQEGVGTTLAILLPVDSASP